MKYAVICFNNDEAKRLLLYPSMDLAIAACDGIDLVDDDRHFGVIWDIDAHAVCSPTDDEWEDDDAAADVRAKSEASMADYYAGLR